ncbi:putative cytokinin dehydrogenase [Lupinus albus]|uniref:Putative cytokinin dehydrogenase n=1 Tax=Lupinus albus TaxID=3870 RepID=A0A6A4NP44_LUPAL|nr:putative cytokinin dehydrogenase [Lupinus albus]
MRLSIKGVTLSNYFLRKTMLSKSPSLYYYEHISFLLIKIFILIHLNFIHKANSVCNNSTITSIIPPSEILSSLQTLALNGNLSLKDIYHFPPLAVLHPKTVSDISKTIQYFAYDIIIS